MSLIYVCDFDCVAGIGTYTQFITTCSGWQGWLGVPSELNYEFRIGLMNANNTQLYYTGVSPVKFGVMFPLGNSSDDYQSSVYILITDSIQDLTVYIVNIKVSIFFISDLIVISH